MVIKMLGLAALFFFLFAMFFFYMHAVAYKIRKKKSISNKLDNTLDGYKYKYHNIVDDD